MSKIEINPGDETMVHYWTVQTEYLLNRLSTSDLKRLIQDINDGINHRVNEEGNIVEADFSVIERDKEEINDRIVEKVRSAKKPREVIEEKLESLNKEVDLPGTSRGKELEAKISVLESVKEEIE